MVKVSDASSIFELMFVINATIPVLYFKYEDKINEISDAFLRRFNQADIIEEMDFDYEYKLHLFRSFPKFYAEVNRKFVVNFAISILGTFFALFLLVLDAVYSGTVAINTNFFLIVVGVFLIGSPVYLFYSINRLNAMVETVVNTVSFRVPESKIEHLKRLYELRKELKTANGNIDKINKGIKLELRKIKINRFKSILFEACNPVFHYKEYRDAKLDRKFEIYLERIGSEAEER